MNFDRLSRSTIVGSLMLTTVVLGASSSFAQELPPGLQKRDAATSGREDVAVAGFATVAEKPKESTDATELKLSAGGLFSGGNSESLALTTSSKLRLRRGDNQFELAVAGNYGEAAPPGEDEREANVENLQGRVRYDRFLIEGLAAFLSTSALRDRFQGLDLRLNIDPGFAYYFLDADKQRFWTELGYDLQYDYRRQDAVDAAAASGSPIDRSETRHGARAFVGYTSELAEGVAFDASVEYLQALKETENWRLGCDVGLTAAIKGGFSLSTTFSLRYDNNPLADVETTDMSSALSLVYQLL
jgi:putative salt-induced outer membrane protein YdiY